VLCIYNRLLLEVGFFWSSSTLPIFAFAVVFSVVSGNFFEASPGTSSAISLVAASTVSFTGTSFVSDAAAGTGSGCGSFTGTFSLKIHFFTGASLRMLFCSCLENADRAA
jgi:hypothetical protein